MILEIGEIKLNDKDFSDFEEIIISVQMKNLKRIEEELDWFIKKFDYRNSDKPWGNSRDSLLRTINKIASIIICDE